MKSEVPTGIIDRIRDYIRVVTEERDATAAASFYSVDARILGPDTDLDHSAISEMMHSLFDAGVRIEIHRRTIEIFEHGDIAYELAEADDRLINPDGSVTSLSNRMFIRWARGEDGLWRFNRVLLSPRTVAS